MIFETNITNSKPQIVSKCHNMINVHKSRRVFQPNFVQLILKGWKHNFQEFCAMIWGISCLQFCKNQLTKKRAILVVRCLYATISLTRFGFFAVLGVVIFVKSVSKLIAKFWLLFEKVQMPSFLSKKNWTDLIGNF